MELMYDNESVQHALCLGSVIDLLRKSSNEVENAEEHDWQ